MALNILLLAAGKSSSERKDEQFPLCLTEFNGVPLIEAIAAKLVPLDTKRTIVAMPEKDVAAFRLDNSIALLFPNSLVIRTREAPKGAACTALLAIEHISNNDELLIVSANELVDVDLSSIIQGFRDRRLDAGTITFPSIHPRYSYVRLDRTGQVVESAQRNPISRQATVGIFWYARGIDFIRASMRMISKDAHVDGLFYICPTFNELILQNAKIGVHEIEARLYHPLKSERQISQFENLSTSQGVPPR